MATVAFVTTRSVDTIVLVKMASSWQMMGLTVQVGNNGNGILCEYLGSEQCLFEDLTQLPDFIK